MEKMLDKIMSVLGKSEYPLHDCRENCKMIYYENSSEEEFETLIKFFKSEDFEALQERELYSNSFALLRKESLSVTALFTPCDSSLRVTVSENASFPSFERASFEEKCPSVFYCFENDQTLIDCGMCLLIQCSDYSFFVVDSGHYLQINDNDRIHKFMRERTPEGQKIVIAGWLITHAHSDHISKLIDFLRYNCDDVIIEGFYSNLIPHDYGREFWDFEETVLAAKFFRILESFNAPKIKLHTGQHFYIRNLEIDVLGTHEDIYPKEICDYNDSSCIITVTVDGTKIFIPGDASALSSEKLEARYGENLKCDIVQIAHHGHNGISEKAYELIAADVAVFPITRIKFEEECPRISANRKAIEIADSYYISSDGTVEIPLPYERGNIKQHPDETFEDFEKIKRLWGYDYTDAYKCKLYDIYVGNGGNLDNAVLPVTYKGTFSM